jgi:hypothetical protein
LALCRTLRGEGSERGRAERRVFSGLLAINLNSHRQLLAGVIGRSDRVLDARVARAPT